MDSNSEPGPTGHQLPTHVEFGGRKTEGFTTPSHDKTPQRMSIPPRRVLPIIFLPGIMGTNLRLTATSGRQQQLHKNNNIAWRPDNLGLMSPAKDIAAAQADAPLRQLLFDPSATEVDVYDPVHNPTGDPNEKADQRHANAKVDFNMALGINTPLLMDDPITMEKRRSKEQKARARGWGEVYFDSYGALLQMCELRLNTALLGGRLDPWWQRFISSKPQDWQRPPADYGEGIAPKPRNPSLAQLSLDDLKQAVHDCWFPVHAMGYNWLQSNKDSGKQVAVRIRQLMVDYVGHGFTCEKVIVVTHSMGGLVARALIHPDMGALDDKVLGVIHGVQPAIGAGAAYKRIRCGFEGFSALAAVPGNFGNEVTAVLGNAPGGLELLPTQAYGNDWLQITANGKTLKSLPQKGDPYEEIYKLRGKWYGLLREEWLNPAGNRYSGYTKTADYLDKAKAFHNAIANTYHALSYAHYGADPKQPAWHKVFWNFATHAEVPDVEALSIDADNMQGTLQLSGGGARTNLAGAFVHASLLPAADPGDGTVPQFSADHQLRSGKFKAVFQQEGYDHQNSYKDARALDSTLYCLVKIAQTMTWSKP